MEEWAHEWVQVTNIQAVDWELNPSCAENPAGKCGIFHVSEHFVHTFFVEQAFTVMQSVMEGGTALKEKNGETRVFGVVYEVEAENADTHSHELYLVTWDGRVLHTHGFSGVTSFDVGHRHGYAGVTEPAPSGVPHTHAYSTVTTFNDGHEHLIRGRTGPAIPLPGGGHYHYFEGVTTVNGRTPHRHAYSGRTGNEQ